MGKILMAYDPSKPVTVSNCPTRHALERTPAPGMSQSIGAKHTREKAERHKQNVAERAMRNANRGRTIKVKAQ